MIVDQGPIIELQGRCTSLIYIYILFILLDFQFSLASSHLFIQFT